MREKELVKVVCIDSNNQQSLTYGKSYSLISNNLTNMSLIIDNSNIEFWYYSNRFISLKEYRRMKLIEINSN